MINSYFYSMEITGLPFKHNHKTSQKWMKNMTDSTHNKIFTKCSIWFKPLYRVNHYEKKITFQLIFGKQLKKWKLNVRNYAYCIVYDITILWRYRCDLTDHFTVRWWTTITFFSLIIARLKVFFIEVIDRIFFNRKFRKYKNFLSVFVKKLQTR